MLLASYNCLCMYLHTRCTRLISSIIYGRIQLTSSACAAARVDVSQANHHRQHRQKASHSRFRATLYISTCSAMAYHCNGESQQVCSPLVGASLSEPHSGVECRRKSLFYYYYHHHYYYHYHYYYYYYYV